MRKVVKMLVAAFIVILMNVTSVCAAQDYSDSELQNMAYQYYKELNCDKYSPIQEDIVTTINDLENGLKEIRVYVDKKTNLEFREVYYIDKATGVGVDKNWEMVDIRKAILYQAMDLYGNLTFVTDTTTWEWNSDIYDEEGNNLERIGFYNIDTYSGLKVYLNKVFADDITQELLTRYRGIDDQLYRINADRGADASVEGWECAEVYQKGNERYFKVIITIEEGWYGEEKAYETCHFKQCYMNGEWRFTEFPYFY